MPRANGMRIGIVSPLFPQDDAEVKGSPWKDVMPYLDHLDAGEPVPAARRRAIDDGSTGVMGS